MIVDLERRWISREDLPCKKHDPELFYPDHGSDLKKITKKVQAKWEYAKDICLDCPVMVLCARDGLGESEGIWGGTDPVERHQLRSANSVRIRKLKGPDKLEYTATAYYLSVHRKLGAQEIARLLGIGVGTATYLIEWHKTWLKERAEQEAARVVDVELPDADVVPIVVEYPVNPPKNGDGWVRYGRRVVAGHYLGQTEDDAWFFFRLKLVGGEYSPCWIKAADVKMTRDMPRCVLVRSGTHGSRIYGPHLSRAKSATG
jgi:transcription factor WhiB